MDYHLAQVNIAHMIAELDDPIMSGFVARLDEINRLAEKSQGFVWRFQTQAGDSIYLRPYSDNSILFNMSVWESIDDLRDYVYASAHLELLKSKGNWFSKPDRPHLALWWIKKGDTPSVAEAMKRLQHLREHGPSPVAFTFANAYPKPVPTPPMSL